MLQVNRISKTYGDDVILHDVSFTVNPGQRAGLVGPNGCGKTTLLRIIVGQEQPDRGSVRTSPADVTIGYLAQALEFEPGATVGDVMRQAIEGLRESERLVETLALALAAAQGDELARLMEEYARALARFEAAGGYEASHDGDATLAGLGLGTVDQATPVETLSGGQKTRLGLACLLLARPQLLLLDEPTNHLDIEALEWLEGWLGRFRGAAIIVSHDRTFLDRTVATILELDPLTHTVRPYTGNYTAYVEQKEARRERQWSQWRDQEYEVRRMKQDIAHTKQHALRVEFSTTPGQPGVRRYAKKVARKARSRERKLERYLESGERVEKPPLTWQMKLDFDETPASGRDVLVLEDVSLGYGDVRLLTGVSVTLRQGERIALVGLNGSGKTTLLRGITGELAPLAGRIRLGTNVRVGYYAQEQEGLDEASNAFEEIRRVAALGETDARNFLHYFLFSGDDVFVPVGSLSFGERARLVLAKLVAAGCNLLLLDEPINHLDLPSRERFEQGLAAFEGTVLAAVHDRYFIERFATGLWSVEGGTVRRYIDLEDLRRP
ncbi:MAG TPA: ABC-F family ATP-binding cassette domain-containing protein [Anaerolineae bacterium]|nr:ABC-F family ATP-binding cassette domain-containing protein [Anaerolineae bacterium]